MPDVALVDQRGGPYRLRTQRGRVLVLAFGYTRCRDLCPLTLGTFKQTHRLLGKDAGRVRFLFVTVDPAWDSPRRLRGYLAAFHPDFIGLTGDREALAHLYRHFGIAPERYAASGRASVGHMTAIYLVDPSGFVGLSFNWGGPPAAIAHDIRLLLAEPVRGADQTPAVP